MPSITTREYNPSTGEFVGNISSLSFGRIVVGTHSPVKVIDFAFVGVTKVSNIKLGLINSGGISVNDTPGQTHDPDGSVEYGKFGVMHTTNFELSVAAGPLTRHYDTPVSGGLASDPNNILISTRSDTVSQFIYLDLQLGNNDLGAKAGVYKIFFDFE
jgi:hypothetical protein